MSDVQIIEVGPRDGLQAEPTPISTKEKLAFITRLAECGLEEIEATSFVSPKWVPQLGDAAALWPQLPPGPKYSALVPNMRGLETALSVGVERIALFTASSDAFTKKNINATVEESLERFNDVAKAFREQVPNGWIRGYISTIFDCPYAGRMEPQATADVAARLWEIGVDEISLGDTTGSGAPAEVTALHELLPEGGPYVWHFHDTRGTALANVQRALDLGYRRFDASAGGLGGCPYAPGAAGNVATEDVLYLLERQGIRSASRYPQVAEASRPVMELLGQSPRSRVQQAVLAASAPRS